MISFVNYLGKMRGYPQFSFWISITLVKIYIPCVVINRGKNTIELVGTVLKLPLCDKCDNCHFVINVSVIVSIILSSNFTVNNIVVVKVIIILTYIANATFSISRTYIVTVSDTTTSSVTVSFSLQTNSCQISWTMSLSSSLLLSLSPSCFTNIIAYNIIVNVYIRITVNVTASHYHCYCKNHQQFNYQSQITNMLPLHLSM